MNKDFQRYAGSLRQATADALNETARNALSMAKKEIKEEYNFRPTDMNKATRISRANVERLQAVITAGGKRIPLAIFVQKLFASGSGILTKIGVKKMMGRKSKMLMYRELAGVPIEVKKGAPKILRHAFLVQFKSGHVAVVSRETVKSLPIGSWERGDFKTREYYAPAPWQLVKGQDAVMAKYYDENLARIMDQKVRWRTAKER